MSSFLELRDRGLYCRPGDFYVDPWKSVERAVITHGHSDHARRGHKLYLTAAAGHRLVRERVGPHAVMETLAFGEPRTVGDVTVSLHPAGHIRGSAQVRMEYRGEVAVVTGDYKREPDPVAEAFEVVPCHTLVTECTFGLPLYQWAPGEQVMADINAWWAANRARGLTSVIFGYALGKSQRILAGLDPSIGPILCHGAIDRFVDLHRQLGVDLPPSERASGDESHEGRGRALVLATPATAGTRWLQRFAPYAAASASGWMATRSGRRQRGLDRGFVLSDHADWPGLLQTVRETGASTVWTTHGFSAPFARHLRGLGLQARELETEFAGEEGRPEPIPAEPGTAA